MSSSMFAIFAFLSTQDVFSSLEARAISTDQYFFIVITAGETKQFSVFSSVFYRCPFSISFSSSLRTLFWKWIGLVFLSVGLMSSFSWISTVKPSIV